MLSLTDKEKIRALIENKIELVKTEISNLEEVTKMTDSGNFIGQIAKADLKKNIKDAETALRQARGALFKLEYSLRLINRPDFGKCIKCGNTISFAKLLTAPETTKCNICN